MATSITIDASVAVKTIIEESFSGLARNVLAGFDLVLAPAHAYAEIAEVIYRKSSVGLIGERQANFALERLPQILTLVPLDAIIVDAFGIARELQHSVYDCLYVAAALKHQTKLITADLKLVTKPRSSRFSNVVLHLADSGILP